MHSRRADTTHYFVYGVYMLALDLDDLPRFNADMPGFGYNRRALVSIHDRDHLPDVHGKRVPLREMVLSHMEKAGIALGDAPKLYMVTNPRIAGYCFNPLTVYYAYRADSPDLAAILMEVNNTHGEQHPYVMHAGTEIPPKRPEETRLNMRRYSAQKAFFVSPFIPMDATYELSATAVNGEGGTLIVHLDEFWDGKQQFTARLWGETIPLTPAALRGVLLRYPFMTLKVIGAIHWEGLKLLWKRTPYRAWRGWRDRWRVERSDQQAESGA